MRTEEQETEMRRLRDENMQLKHQIKCQKPEKKILGMELPPEVKPKTRLTSSNQRVSQVEVRYERWFQICFGHFVNLITSSLMPYLKHA